MEGLNKLTRYSLAYDFMLKLLNTVLNNKQSGLAVMAQKEFFVLVSKKMNLSPDGFDWDEFSVSIEKLDEYNTAIVYTFPKPREEPEALYGAIVIDNKENKLGYFTLEKGLREGRWAIGMNTIEGRNLIGIFDMNPSKNKFFELLMGPVRFYIEGRVEYVLTMPPGYTTLQATPNDPDNCVSYAQETEECVSFVMAYPIGFQNAMDFGNAQTIIDGIHNALSDNQALIEVKTGKTERMYHYAYSIIKNKMQPSGVQYFMLLQIMYGHVVLNIKAFFDEKGMTGLRDTMVWEQLRREGIVSESDNSAWTFDPYDSQINRSYLMNLSEQEKYDSLFPGHPLSVCRQFAKYVIEQSYLWK